MPDAPRISRVERDDVEVLFTVAADEPAAIREAWDRLEAVVPLRGRKFFAACDIATGTYQACVVRIDSDEPTTLGLEVGVIPGGTYAKLVVTGEPPAVYEDVPAAFKVLEAAAPHDATRPHIEFYKRRDEIHCLLPVLD